MKIEDKLEIVIPTFNRCEKLDITFSYLLGENSPVKNCDITILDNCSTDDTPNLVKKIAEKHPNVHYRRNARNIGCVANIDRSVEIATKRYLWAIGDDDTYDWACWNEVEKAIEDEADAIVVGYGNCTWKPRDPRVWAILPGGQDILGCLIINMGFVNDGIYSQALGIRATNIQNGIMVLYCNRKPDFRVSTVSAGITITYDEARKEWNRIPGYTDLRSSDTSLGIYCRLLKDRKLLDICLRRECERFAWEYIVSLYSSVIPIYPATSNALVFFAVIPWKWKFYILAVGHWKLFKRALRKLVHFDFTIKKL